MSTTSSDDGWLCQTHLHNQFEVCEVARNTTVFECTELAMRTERADSRGTFASTPVQALQVFLAEHPQHTGCVRLRVCSLRRPVLVFDLDPLQYTRAYPTGALSLYVGAAIKQQRRKVLGDIHEYLVKATAEQRPELDALLDLTRTSGSGFEWDADACVDEVMELHPLASGIHFCAPGASLFDPRLLRLLRRRVHMHEHGTINLEPSTVDLLRSAPVQYPPPRLWPLAVPDERTMQVHSIGLPEPTGFTSLNQTGWRHVVDLRHTLLEHVHSCSFERHTTEQADCYTALLRQCAALVPA